MRILGISAFYHDSAAALIDDGQIGDGSIIAAVQEERFSRKKNDERFPAESIRYCLKKGRCVLEDLDYIVFYDKPFLKFDRILETFLAVAPKGFQPFLKAMPAWMREKLFLKDLLLDELCTFSSERRNSRHTREHLRSKLLFSEHHFSHAASAYFPSPFDDAAILILDGVGEWATGSTFYGRQNEIVALNEMLFPHSLGLLYSAFTSYIGFKVNSGEYKLMGLAPYGKPKYTKVIFDHLIDLKDDGSFRLDLSYFDFLTGLRMTNAKFHQLFGGPPRTPEANIDERHCDIAASIQAVTEEVILRMTRHLRREVGAGNLCLAGGVALNCVANGKILRDQTFKKIWIQPAAGDAGGALGAAYAGLYGHAKRSRIGPRKDLMQAALLGPEFSDDEICLTLNKLGAKYVTLPTNELLSACASLLASGKALAWFQGRMEFGPRALGSRSILADPRVPEMRTILNEKVKLRETFRPFAPAILREDLEDWFNLDTDSPYMLLVAETLKDGIPSVTHVDKSARVQTIHKETNPKFHDLLTEFKKNTGCPILINTSFNIRGEPIVCTPHDAYRCFMGTDLDALAIGSFLLLKGDQDPDHRELYGDKFEKD